jgi:hypothetical protein
MISSMDSRRIYSKMLNSVAREVFYSKNSQEFFCVWNNKTPNLLNVTLSNTGTPERHGCLEAKQNKIRCDCSVFTGGPAGGSHM